MFETRVFGDVAVALAHGTNRGSWQRISFGADEWVTDVFVRRGEGWRCTMSALTPNNAAASTRPMARWLPLRSRFGDVAARRRAP